MNFKFLLLSVFLCISFLTLLPTTLVLANTGCASDRDCPNGYSCQTIKTPSSSYSLCVPANSKSEVEKRMSEKLETIKQLKTQPAAALEVAKTNEASTRIATITEASSTVDNKKKVVDVSSAIHNDVGQGIQNAATTEDDDTENDDEENEEDESIERDSDDDEENTNEEDDEEQEKSEEEEE
ncbi:hypothetical protein ABK040_015694 [Willaertia magna]